VSATTPTGVTGQPHRSDIRRTNRSTTRHWQKKVVDELNAFKKDHPTRSSVGRLAGRTDQHRPVIKGMASEDGKHTFVSIPLKGDNDDTS